MLQPQFPSVADFPACCLSRTPTPQVARLRALLEAEKLQAAFSQERMAGALGEERRRRERAERTHRDAVLQR